MVESTNDTTKKAKTTVLPTATAQEPSDALYMAGSKEELVAAVFDALQDVTLNPLEEGLMKRYLESPEENSENISKLLLRVIERVPESYEKKAIRRILPLFEKHEFWSTQPVSKIYEKVTSKDMNMPIEVKTLDEVQKTPFGLPQNYEWAEVDLLNEEHATELYDLLTHHYVEDDGGKFRFDYQPVFLKWALTPPGYKKDWLVGIRGGADKKLYAFISGIPVRMVCQGKTVEMAEINFLCVHKNLRKFRVAPVLIKEITRRVNSHNIWQAIYTAGVTLPTPFAAANYWHRNLDPQKLVECQFAFKPADKSMAQFIKMHKLPAKPVLDGLRPMNEKDIRAATHLINNHMRQNYQVHIEFSEAEVAHFLLPQKDVVYTYVVENDAGQLTDLTSFYALPSSVLGHPKHTTINAAYGFYNVPCENKPERVKLLMRDLLIVAKNEKFDVFNMTEVMQHKQVTGELMFKPGDGRLHHYLYNWRIPSLQPEQVGIVLV